MLSRLPIPGTPPVTASDPPEISDLSVYTTERCNLDCTYCYVDKGTQARSLDAPTLLAGIDHFLRFPPRAKDVAFGGGEPLLLLPVLREVLPAARRLAEGRGIDLSVTLFTNGTLLSPARFRFLEDQGVQTVVSLDGPRALHDRHRPFLRGRRRSSYDAVMRAIEGIDRRRLAVSAVFLPAEAAGVPDYVRTFSALGFEAINYYPDAHARWRPEEIAVLRRAFAELGEVIEDAYARERVIRLFWVEYFHRRGFRRTARHCGRLMLGPDGIYYPCKAVLSLPAALRRRFALGAAADGVDLARRRDFLRWAEAGATAVLGPGLCGESFCPFNTYAYFTERGDDAAPALREFREVSVFFADFCRRLADRLGGVEAFRRAHGLGTRDALPADVVHPAGTLLRPGRLRGPGARTPSP